MGIKRVEERNLEYQDPIPRPPIEPESMNQSASENDRATVDHWRDTWIRNARANKEKFGSFAEKGIHRLYNQWKWQPCIIIGAGPSLRFNAHRLKAGELKMGDKVIESWKGNPGIKVISCLHNFAWLTDLGVKVDLWCTLDAGDIVINEIFEGGTKDHEFYRKASESQKVLAYIGTNPLFFDNWRGEVNFFNSILPNQSLQDAVDEVEVYIPTVSSGGNVLGGCMYIAKAMFGCNPIIFMGVDYCYDKDHQFHPWKSKYDKLGRYIRVVDVYGDKSPTWRSYLNFKTHIELTTLRAPGVYINCTEGGLLGAYPEGNIIQIEQMPLEKALEMYRISDHPYMKDTMTKFNENQKDKQGNWLPRKVLF